MESRIITIEDVKNFFAQLVKEDLNFHPDTPFEEYVCLETNKPTYSDKSAKLRNEMLAACFEVCEKKNIDIYELAMDTFPAPF